MTLANTTLDVYLAEYASLRAEQLARMQIQFSAVTWLSTIIGAFSAVFAFLLDKDYFSKFPWVAPLVLEILPIAATPIAFMTFDHMIMVHRIGHHFADKLAPAIRGVLGPDSGAPFILQWDPKDKAPKGSLLSMKYFFFPLGAWLLFVLCIPAPVIVVIAMHWPERPFPVLLVLDLFVTIAFVYGSAVAWNERADWLHTFHIRLPGLR